MNHLHCGGAEKALISLLQTIDYSSFEVDLLLFKKEGMFMNQLPSQVRLLESPSDYLIFDMPIRQAITSCLKRGKLKLAWARIRAGLIFKSEKNPARCEQLVWKHLSRAMPALPVRYDAAIGYLEKNPVYYCIEKVKAEKKLGFIHTEYSKLGMDPALDQKHFAQLDYIVTVSKSCGDVLKRSFPAFEKKIEIMHNIVSPSLVLQLSQKGNPYSHPYAGCRIVSMGRLHSLKGFDMAIEACRMMIDKGIPVQWYIIGEGEERERLKRSIEQHKLQEHFHLLGLQENPYPFIKHADIYVQPSRFEGKSIAVDEAKILAKPIVVTNFSTANDAVASMVNGLIVDMNAAAIAAGIERLWNDPALRDRLIKRLELEEPGTEAEISALYRFIS
nr:glycosyltransferase [Paenibacillus sp. HB172176]